MNKGQFRFFGRQIYAALFVASLLATVSGFGLISAGFDNGLHTAQYAGQIEEVVVVG